MGIIFSIVAGILMSIQGVFNTNVGKKIGLWETSIVVQGVALVSTIIIFLFMRNGNWSALGSVNKLYLTGGIIGALITVTVMLGMNNLGPTYAVTLILIAQLLAAALIEAFGIFGVEQLRFGINKYLGLVMMIIGIIIFKYK
ncbi:DMT family transporter [Hathewaya histolytica]|uniref:Membrane protein n=1 Tax=Hathewaya histolytica TaxID=1498 RepID=A0A4U9RUR5_HATHI|nr:DMT family transporter [Hathewaya histolytica]VTQ96212.1 membrane protein [Hathewaya histolytica]